MNYQEIVLAALNVFQAIALAYITLRQAEVKRELNAHNGEQAASIRALRAALAEQSAAVGLRGSR